MGSMMRLLTLLLILLGTGARAAESTPFTTARDSVSLVSKFDSATPDRPVRLGLRFRLAPGWHTYWSNPGDAGAPPSVDVTGGSAGPFAYPVPQRLREGPFTSYAYTGEVLLPFTVTPAPGPFSVSAHADWLVCATVCVPEAADFKLALPAGPGAPGGDTKLFAAADTRLPRPSPFPAHVSPEGILWLAAPGLSLRDALFFPAEAGVIDQDAPQVLDVRPDRIEIALKFPKEGSVGPVTGVLTLTDRDGQVESLSVQSTPMALPAGGERKAIHGLAEALLLAFAGGLVLNLMPCVLPVLAMKALALARLSGAARAHVRLEVAAYTLGVVATFVAIGGATLAVRALGGAAGWGMQFQSAGFTTAMALLLFAIGLNFSGVFEVGATLAGAGQGLAARGSFFTGLLAVLVATPCTAPFMGTALAAALALPPVAGLLVFVALGLGMAAPYAALALSPRIAALLPRPGAWMEFLRHLLAFPMYGAALWMVWVASQQTDPAGLAAVFAGLLLTGFCAWAYGFGQTRKHAPLLRASAAIALACLVAVLADVGLATPRAMASQAVAADGSEPFSASRLAALQAAHRPVFVDMSAAWCVTCLVNERLALAPRAMRDAFAQRHVVYMKGDWTRQDAGITAFLRAYDRSGVPLYVFYPASGTATVLPQILTPGLVLAAIGAG